MAASGDVQIAQDGGITHIKLHPYLVALIRWCVSSVWSTATLLLHRFMTAPLPPASGQKPPKPRPASSDHLHPEPRVDCEVLHTPPAPTIDVIFVHGLYGSLGNTWRQGEWRVKYNSDPTIVPLRRCSITADNATRKDLCDNATQNDTEIDPNCITKEFDNMFKSNESSFKSDEKKFYEDIRKILPKDNAFITEKFYNNTLLDQVEIVGNYETQANFVKDLFERQDECQESGVMVEPKDCNCKMGDVKCEAGCGCVCDECYSPCWPRDWIRVDYPEARIISINYTSDPYLWRPLWIKESKRQRLHERAEQMMEQLLALGVGQRPIIWVGHSKGGLFIKHIYCEAYEAYQKLHKPDRTEDATVTNEQRDQFNSSEYNNDNMINHNLENKDTDNSTYVNNNIASIEDESIRINDKLNDDMQNECVYIENSIKEAFHFNDGDCDDKSNLNTVKVEVDRRQLFKDVYISKHSALETIEGDAFNPDNMEEEESLNGSHSNFQTADTSDEIDEEFSNDEEERSSLQLRASLWSRSAGFMFYSVPHRGSPLADIKTPITARSIELMEICKDCSLVVSLQARWQTALAAAAGGAGGPATVESGPATVARGPAVRSLVETCRTLMSVLWLRIVSVDSADPGTGALSGVNVDHREICKPAGRACPLYRELVTLIDDAIHRYHTQH